MSAACPHAHLDGAYVLGALSGAERRDYEQHLAGCEECSRAVRELAGLPGLLSRVDADVLETPGVPPPVPATLLPSLLGEVRRARRRRLLVTSGLVAAVLVLAVALPLSLRQASDGGSQATPVAAAAMTPLRGAPVRAQLGLQSVAWGTKLDLACTYDPSAEQYEFPRVATYVLVVHTRDGHAEEVGTWQAVRGKTMRLSAATAARPDQIADVEVQTTSGRSVLRLSS
jgi:hypothetical protein